MWSEGNAAKHRWIMSISSDLLDRGSQDKKYIKILYYLYSAIVSIVCLVIEL